MRRPAVALALLLLPALAACQQEPSFDERYDAAQKKVGGTATRLDREMATADSSAEADRRALEAAEKSAAGAASPAPTT